MHATLVPGKVYIVGFGWNAAVDFYRSPGQPSSWPLGSRFGSGGINGAVNPVAGAQAFIGPLAATEYSMRMSFSITGCYADCDGVGGLTGNDFQCFLDAFVAGKPYANCDGVGGLTGNDFQCFLDKFVAGCP
jgi:hypothetical protein